MPPIAHVRIGTSFFSLLALVAVTGLVRADDDADDVRCRDFAGAFSSMAVPVPPCQSPIGLCTHGTLGPNFPGTYDATFLAMYPANDPNDPTKFFYLGVSTITPGTGNNIGKRGVLTTADTGVIHIPGGGAPNPFVTTATINGGTKKFVNATGQFVASGSIDFATGQATGTYTAKICRKGDGDDHGHHGRGCDDDD